MTGSALRDFLKAGVADRRGETQIAANLSRQAMENVDWDDAHCVYSDDEWGYYLDDTFQWMTAYVITGLHDDLDDDDDADGPPNRVLLCANTWDTLSCEPAARERFVQDMQAGGPGMKFISTDDGLYASAVRREAAVRGTDHERTRDALTTLGEEVKSLVTAAASINGNFDETQQQTFAVQYARLRTRHEELEAQVEDVGAMLQLAATALWGT